MNGLSVAQALLPVRFMPKHCEPQFVTPRKPHSQEWLCYWRRLATRTNCRRYNARMTLVEVTYQLQLPLRAEQLNALGRLANLYGLRRFRVDQERNQISLEYDGSRLKEIQLADALRGIKIPVGLRV